MHLLAYIPNSCASLGYYVFSKFTLYVRYVVAFSHPRTRGSSMELFTGDFFSCWINILIASTMESLRFSHSAGALLFLSSWLWA